MYKYQSHTQSSIKRNNSIEGETIEMKLERVINNGEGVQGNAPMIYTERKDGIMPAYDIRTDRFDIAIDGTDKISKSRFAKREEKAEMKVVKDDKVEPTQGTDGNQ